MKKKENCFERAKVAIDLLGVLAVFMLFIVHVVFTVLYLSPPNPVKNAVSLPVYKYMGSLFYQNWHLFSPNPGVKYNRLEVACLNDKPWPSEVHWGDVEFEKQSLHEKTRLLGVSKSLQYYRHIGDSTWNQFVSAYQKCKVSNSEVNRCIELAKANVESSVYFKLISRYAREHCAQKDSSHYFKVRLVRSNPVAFSKRAHFKELQNAETLSFADPVVLEVTNENVN